MEKLYAYSQVNQTLTFSPKFQIIATNFELAADIINRPHEDYPHRVCVTKEIIEAVVSKFIEDYDTRHTNTTEIISSYTIRAIHSAVMGIDTVYKSIKPLESRGKYRLHEVTIADNVNTFTCPPTKIQERMEQITPLNFSTNLTNWYLEFQTIHPFEDGNGRVGGIVLAIMSSLILNKDEGNVRLSPNMLVPCQ